MGEGTLGPTPLASWFGNWVTGDVVTQRTAAHLRLHVEEGSKVKSPRLDEVHSLHGLCDSFRRITGWSLQCRAEGPPAAHAIWSRSIDQAEGDRPCVVSMDSGGGFPGGNRVLPDARCSQEAAQDLAEAIADLLQELHQTRCALWQREAELAAGVPVMPHPDEQTHLAERLESV